MLITKQKDLDKFLASLHDCNFVTVDTEFLREKTYYPKLCLIQIGDPDQNAVAIDPLEGNLDMSGVYDLMRNQEILKIFHASRQDLEIFYNLMGEVPTPLFDTQIAAMVCGYGDSVGYENLVRNITGNDLDKSVQFTNWAHRPLSDKQLNYALGDVTHLVKIYEKLADQLEERGRTNWVYEEEEVLLNPETYQNNPEKSWERIKLKTPKPKTLAVLKALAAWREETAQKRDIPRPWVMRDDTLVDMAAQAPTDINNLKKIRNMSSDMAEGKVGKTILPIIKAALASDPKTWPSKARKKPLPPSTSATMDILKMLLKIECVQHGVAAKLVASNDDLEAIAGSDSLDVKALKGWRYEVFGKDALALKAGELSIGLKDGKITKYKVHGDSDLYVQEKD